MKKRVIFLVFCVIFTMMISGCDSEENSSDPVSTDTEVTAEANEAEMENEIEVLSYSYDNDIITAVLLDKKENILYGLVEVFWNLAGSQPGEFFMLVDTEGNPYVYDGKIPELILDKEEANRKSDSMTYVFTDSVYNIRYALLFTSNNRAGAYTGNVITLLDVNGKPSIKK